MEEIKTDETTKSNIRKDIEKSNSASEQWQILLSHQKGEILDFFSRSDQPIFTFWTWTFDNFIFRSIETKRRRSKFHRSDKTELLLSQNWYKSYRRLQPLAQGNYTSEFRIANLVISTKFKFRHHSRFIPKLERYVYHLLPKMWVRLISKKYRPLSVSVWTQMNSSHMWTFWTI